ncbi:hypothetical protein HRbin11_01605 [bacterium HR11]|nr:hypothetical protein HRbin11_01605 [bacterium HR11]
MFPNRPFRLLSVLSVMAGLGLSALSPMPAGSGPASPTPAPSEKTDAPAFVLLLPFENRTGRPDLFWLGEAIVEVVGHNVELDGPYVIPPHWTRRQVFEAHGFTYPLPLSLPTALWLARQSQAALLVTGYYRSSGEKASDLTITVQMADPAARRPLEQWSVQGTLAGFPDLLQRLLETLRSRLARAGIPARVADRFWPSVPMESFEPYVKALWTDPPSDRFDRLVRLATLAPTFEDIRWAQVWTAMELNGLDDAAAAALDQWVQQRSAQPMDPQERLWVATWHYLRQRWPVALQTLLDLSTQDPGPVISNDLGIVLAVMGQTDQARYYIDRALRLRPDAPVLAWNRLMLALLTEDWPYVREAVPTLWPTTFHPTLLVGAAWAADRLHDRTSAQWLYLWAQNALGGQLPEGPGRSWVHTQWRWIPVRTPYWAYWRREGPREALSNSDTGDDPAQGGGWTRPEELHAWLDRLMQVSTGPRELDRLEAVLGALAWVYRKTDLIYYEALLLDRRGDRQAAYDRMRQYYEATHDPRALQWLEAHPPPSEKGNKAVRQ